MIFIDFLDGFCYNSNIARYCVEAFDTPGRHGVRPAEMVRGIVTEPLSRGPTTPQVLSEKNVAGKAAEIQCRVNGWMRHHYSSAWLCIVFFSGLPAFFLCFGGFGDAGASREYGSYLLVRRDTR